MLLTNLTLIDDEKTKQKREQICTSCDHFSSIKMCVKCGCVMPVKWNFKFAVCPLNKW